MDILHNLTKLQKPEPTNFTIFTESTLTYLTVALQDISMQYTQSWWESFYPEITIQGSYVS